MDNKTGNSRVDKNGEITEEACYCVMLEFVTIGDSEWKMGEKPIVRNHGEECRRNARSRGYVTTSFIGRRIKKGNRETSRF